MTRADGADPVIALRHATVGYHDRPVLRDISLTVARGEVLAILGANGSGKSTLVRALLGLLPLAAGTLTLFGRPLAGPAPGRRGRFRQWHRIGYVPQRLGAGSGVPATVAEVVASGRLARRGRLRLWLPRRSGAGGGAAPAAGSRRGTDRSGVAAAIESVGLTSRRHDPVSTLSGGQQQRVLIARALAAEPDLLVLDEPTAGVDAASQQSFADTVRRFVAGGGTAVLVAHELGPMSELVSRAVVLHHGELVHDGPVPEPAGHHAQPGHDHVHPHAPTDPPGLWHEGLPR